MIFEIILLLKLILNLNNKTPLEINIKNIYFFQNYFFKFSHIIIFEELIFFI